MAVQWIVNGWDFAWRCGHVLWESSAQLDDFDRISAALHLTPPAP